MKSIITLLLLIFATNVTAGNCYFDLAVGVHDKDDDIILEDGRMWENNLGRFEFGCTYKHIYVSYLHISSLRQDDHGLNIYNIGIRVWIW